MAQRFAPPLPRYYTEPIEPPSRLPSPWATMTTPSPSPCPPPSPAVWMPRDWTPVAPTSRAALPRSLPLLPGTSHGRGGISGVGEQEAHELHEIRTNTTYSPLPSHPEFLRNLHSHPLIIERGGGGDSDSDPSRTPSPASSVEIVQQPTYTPAPPPNANAKFRAVGSPVPFPSDLRFASPSPMHSGTSSPRPLPSVHGSQQSLRSVPSDPPSRQSPARSPDSAAALSSPRRNPVAMPRARVPAMGTPPAVAQQPREANLPKHPVFYMQEGMVVLKVRIPACRHSLCYA
ncbi:hypothetical protein C8Q77DRAFT_767164 [Trametes polyzona]|nr:hypothetical protein C8Q77DRAFT_767164 [Trametes polyzona]